jgi:enoyl-CoA hydratase
MSRGLYPVGAATVRLHREIGWGNALLYLLTADEILAAEGILSFIERRKARFKGQ